jgi:hypothetical protein
MKKKQLNPRGNVAVTIPAQRVKVGGRLVGSMYACNTVMDFNWYPSWMFARYARPEVIENSPRETLALLKSLWDDDILGKFLLF